MKVLQHLPILAFICLFCACDNDGQGTARDTDTRETTTETPRDRQDTIRIGPETDDEVEIHVTD